MSRFCGREVSSLYAKFRPVMPDALISSLKDFLDKNGLEKRPPLSLCLDLGCGPGTSTQHLTRHFPEIPSFIALDNSHTQIEEAVKSAPENGNISYRVQDANEMLPVEANSVDLVTCVQSAHWMDLHKLFKECERVLKPGGVMAVANYELCSLKVRGQTETENGKVSEILKRFYDFLIQGHYWDHARHILDSRFEDFQFPYQDQLIRADDPKMCTVVEYKLDQFFRYVDTMSGLRNYFSQVPERNEFFSFKEELISALPPAVQTEQEPLIVVFPWYLIACRKPLS